MLRDGVANIVIRLQERGFDPRKVGSDAWESRCPGHRSADCALSITRDTHNHVVLSCRGEQNCQQLRVIAALGMTNDHLYAETPDWLISRLRRVEVQVSSAVLGERNANDASLPADEPLNGSAGAAPLSEPEAKVPIVDERTDGSRSNASAPQVGSAFTDISSANEAGRVAAEVVPGDCTKITWEHPEIAPDRDGATASPGGQISQSVALSSGNATMDAAQESPTDALMRMAGVDRVVLGSDGRSYALVSVSGKVECRELKSKAFRNLLTHAASRRPGNCPRRRPLRRCWACSRRMRSSTVRRRMSSCGSRGDRRGCLISSISAIARGA